MKNLTKELSVFFLFFLVVPRLSFAYIDPGTGGYIFSSFGYIMGFLGLFLVMLIRPFKYAYYLIKDKFKKSPQCPGKE